MKTNEMFNFFRPVLALVIPDYEPYPPWEDIKHWFSPKIPKNIFRRREKDIRKWFNEVFSKEQPLYIPGTKIINKWTWEDVEEAYENRRLTLRCLPRIKVN